MKKHIALLIFSLLCGLSYSNAQTQILHGTVYDNSSKKPIADVVVYLDGTSLYTNTDAAGRFELKTDKIINTKLVLTHISYQTLTVANPFEKVPEKLYLKEKENVLTEVTVQADQFSRVQKLKAFREQFLGTTKAGKSCSIENEGDIRISYNRQTQTLTATSEKPIVIVNNFLGYRIQFSLVDFHAQFFGNKITPDYCKQSFFAGTSLFEDLKPNDRKTQKRRNEVYEYSAANFLKNMAGNKLGEAKYAIFTKQSQINPAAYFDLKDTLSQTRIRIKPNTAIETRKIGINQPLSGIIGVLYKRVQSEVYFLTDEIFIDQYGNNSAIDNILFGGHFGDLRAGDMLPLDYEIK